MNFSKRNKYSFNPDTFPFFGVAAFLLAVIYFWKKLVSVFKPDTYVNSVDKPVEQVNQVLTDQKQIIQGHFVAGGVTTRYTISQARQQAEELASLLKTSKSQGWFSVVLNFSFSDRNKRVKQILNPAYPNNYRRYVIQLYRDVFTNQKSLQTDVRDLLTTTVFATSSWTNDLTKYFTI